jgi:hypothetical protein
VLLNAGCNIGESFFNDIKRNFRNFNRNPHSEGGSFAYGTAYVNRSFVKFDKPFCQIESNAGPSFSCQMIGRCVKPIKDMVNFIGGIPLPVSEISTLSKESAYQNR